MFVMVFARVLRVVSIPMILIDPSNKAYCKAVSLHNGIQLGLS